MNFTIIGAPQRSPEWHSARAGRLTGSCAADMMAKIKTGEAAARRDLRARLALERITGLPEEDGYVSKEMQRGIDREADALAAYEIAAGELVQRSGFLSRSDLMAGCSLDGHIGDFIGIAELKCPKSATHLRYLRSKVVPVEHYWQCVHNLWVSGALWCDFVSFDDRFPPALQLWRVRLSIDDFDLEGYDLAVRLFLSEVEREEAEVRALAAAA